MASFKDIGGQAWDVHIALGDLLRVKSRLKLSLINLTTEDRGADQASKDLDRLRSDLPLFCAVVFCLVSKQAEARGVTEDQFADLLDGPVVIEAISAIAEELVVFTQSRPNKEKARAAERMRSQAIADLIQGEQSRAIERWTAAPLSAEEAAEIKKALTGGTGSASSKSATKSPGQPE